MIERYELRLLRRDGTTVALFSFRAADDEMAKSGIFAAGDLGYDRYEVWRGMECIAEGVRFICPNGADVTLDMTALPPVA